MALNLAMAKLTNPNARFVGILSIAKLSEKEHGALMADIEEKYGHQPLTHSVRYGPAS